MACAGAGQGSRSSRVGRLVRASSASVGVLAAGTNRTSISVDGMHVNAVASTCRRSGWVLKSRREDEAGQMSEAGGGEGPRSSPSTSTPCFPSPPLAARGSKDAANKEGRARAEKASHHRYRDEAKGGSSLLLDAGEDGVGELGGRSLAAQVASDRLALGNGL
jgi:hypothetical protein